MPEVLTIVLGVGGLLGVCALFIWAIAAICNKYL